MVIVEWGFPLLSFTSVFFIRWGIMKREIIEQYVADKVEAMLTNTALELVDVEYVREKDWYLRVFIDKEGGVDLEDCRSISEQLSKLLDQDDPIGDSYLLEVSSPGLDRILKKEKDFIRYAGRMVDIHLFAPLSGTKALVGKLMQKKEDKLYILIDEEECILEMKQIAQVRLHIDF